MNLSVGKVTTCKRKERERTSQLKTIGRQEGVERKGSGFEGGVSERKRFREKSAGGERSEREKRNWAGGLKNNSVYMLSVNLSSLELFYF